MRSLYKFRYSIPRQKPFIKSQTSSFHNVPASIHSHKTPSKSRKKDKTQDTHSHKPPQKPNEFTSILTQITDIIQPQTSTTSTSNARAKNLVPKQCSPTVCENVTVSTKLRIDVSPIVHRITKIVRAEHALVPMENRLENASFECDPDVVEKVLKRCFKVGDLALRFFNWLRNVPGFRHTIHTYNTMIYIAGEAKEFGVVEQLVDQMEKDGVAKDIKTWTILISSYGNAKVIGEALLVFETMKKSGCEPDGKVYNVIVRALCNAGRADIAMEFYKEMVSRNIEVGMNLYKLLLNCLSRAGCISEVRKVGEDMMNLSGIPEQRVYSNVLKSFCVARRIREALELLQELKDKTIMLDPENFEILVKGLCGDGKVSDALEIIDIMKQNHVVDGKIYGIIVTGYLRRNEVLKAFEMFTCMKELGHVPSASTYTELLQYLFRSREYDRACKLYDEMLEKGIQTDVVTMTAVVAGHIQNNHVLEAWKVFKTMEEKGIRPTYKFYTVAIKELCKISETEEALKLVNKMRDSKMKVANEIFQFIIFALEKNGELEKVDNVKQMWKSFTLYGQANELPVDDQSPYRGTETVSEHPRLCQELESSQKKQGEVKIELLQPLDKQYSDGDLQEICGILSSRGNWNYMQEALENCAIHFTPELVLEVLHRCQLEGHSALKFFSWVGQQACYRHTTETYNMAIKVSGSAKDFNHMRILYHEMKRKNCAITSNTWTIMIMQYGRAGLTDIALKKFEEMKADGFEPNKSTYKYLIMLLCDKKGRKVDEAIKVFHQMLDAGHVPDKELAGMYLNCLCEVGKLSDARWCMDSLRKCGFTVPLRYSLVIRSLCRAGKLEEALALVAEAGEEKSTLNQYIYGSLVHGLLRAGRVEEALAKVDEMKQAGVTPTVHVNTSLIVHFFKEKQIEKALNIFRNMREQACEPTVVTYSALIRGYMNMGMVSDARNVFRRMKLKGPFPDFKTYSMFITCLCEIGMSEEALQLMNEMLDGGIVPSTVNFRTIFYGLNREGKKNIAHTVLQKKWALASKRKLSQSKGNLDSQSVASIVHSSPSVSSLSVDLVPVFVPIKQIRDAVLIDK